MSINLFLAPASSENLRRSITQSVDPGLLKEHLRPGQLEELRSKAGSIDGIRCWAVTEHHLNHYLSMKGGDIVLFSENRTDLFNYIGGVIHKVQSRDLGNRLWSHQPGKPWKFIYFLEDVRNISLPKSMVLVKLGYASNDHLQSHRYVKPLALGRISPFGTIDEFLEAIQ